MHRFMAIALAALFIPVLPGCESDPGYATWSVGLEVTGTGTIQTLEREFVHREGVEPFESKGLLTSGTFANDSSGEKSAKMNRTVESTWTVVGETRLNNPLVPGEPCFSDVPVAIVEAVSVENGTDEMFETTVSEPTQGIRHKLEEVQVEPVTAETTASTFGFAGDEYVVLISDLDLLWDPDLVARWRATGTPLPGVDHLVRKDVSVGDFWVSPDGSTLYKAVARESVDIGGRRVAAVKVELRKAGNAGDRILDRCIGLAEVQDARYTTEGPRVPDERDQRVLSAGVNPGCEGDFTHYRVGFQWWYQNVLVAEDTTTYQMRINDYGFEWTTYDGGKARKTAKQLPTNAIPGDARLFVQYTYTTAHRTYRTTGWATPGTPWSE